MVTLYGHEIAVKIYDVGDESGVQRLHRTCAARVQWLKENSNNNSINGATAEAKHETPSFRRLANFLPLEVSGGGHK